MKFLFKTLLLGLLLTPFALLALVFFTLEKEPLVVTPRALNARQVERAQALLKAHDPRTASEGEVRTIRLSEEQLNLVVSQLVKTLNNGGAAISVRAQHLDLRLTIPVPIAQDKAFLNLDVGFAENAALPSVTRCKLGRLSVPPPLADHLLIWFVDYLYSRPGYSFAKDVLQEVAFEPRGTSMTYQWHHELGDAVRSSLVSVAEQKWIKEYHNQLTRIIAEQKLGRRTNLAQLLQPLFALAAQRREDADPIVENRALILMLAAYVNGRDLGTIVTDINGVVRAPWRRVTLHGRVDLAQHFLTSAALSVKGGADLSKAIGLFKEVDDSKGGSGFSFTDLQADDAGTRFGELASASTRAARELQLTIAKGLSEENLLPSVAGLPERLSAQEFKRRYGKVGSAKYNAVVAEIERRITTSPLYN